MSVDIKDIQPPSPQEIRQLYANSLFPSESLTDQEIKELQEMYCDIVNCILKITQRYDLQEIQDYAKDKISFTLVFHELPLYWACLFLEHHYKDYTKKEAWKAFNEDYHLFYPDNEENENNEN